MNDQERLLFLEAIIEAQNEIIQKYASVLNKLFAKQGDK